LSNKVNIVVPSVQYQLKLNKKDITLHWNPNDFTKIANLADWGGTNSPYVRSHKEMFVRDITVSNLKDLIYNT
jgi:hypothetical protein